MSPGLRLWLPPELLDTLLVPLVRVALEAELEAMPPAFKLDVCATEVVAGLEFEELKDVV